MTDSTDKGMSFPRTLRDISFDVARTRQAIGRFERKLDANTRSIQRLIATLEDIEDKLRRIDNA